MSLTNRKSRTHFLTPSAYNRFLHRLTSRRRSDSSISDAESIQSSQTEEQGVEDVKGKKTAEDPLKVVDRVHMKTDRKVELLTPLPPLKAEEKIFFSLSDYNRFLHRLTSRRSDSSMSDAQSIQSSQVECQGPTPDRESLLPLKERLSPVELCREKRKKKNWLKKTISFISWLLHYAHLSIYRLLQCLGEQLKENTC